MCIIFNAFHCLVFLCVFNIKEICEKHCYFLWPLWRCGRERGSAVWQSEWLLPPYGALWRHWLLRFLRRSFRSSCWTWGPRGWAGPALATTEPRGPLLDTARPTTRRCCTRGSREVGPKQMKWGQKSCTRSQSVLPLVVKSWLSLLLSSSLILILTVCARHCLHIHDPYICSCIWPKIYLSLDFL